VKSESESELTIKGEHDNKSNPHFLFKPQFLVFLNFKHSVVRKTNYQLGYNQTLTQQFLPEE